MNHLCDNWSLMSAILDHMLGIDPNAASQLNDRDSEQTTPYIKSSESKVVNHW